MKNFSIIRPLTGSFAATAVPVRLFYANPKRKSASVYNNESTTVYVLSSNNQVAADGKPIPATDERVWKHFDCQGDLWVIGTASAAYDLRIEEVLQE